MQINSNQYPQDINLPRELSQKTQINSIKKNPEDEENLCKIMMKKIIRNDQKQEETKISLEEKENNEQKEGQQEKEENEIQIQMISDFGGEAIHTFKIDSLATGEDLKIYIFWQILDYITEEQMDLFCNGVKIENHKQLNSYRAGSKGKMQIHQKVASNMMQSQMVESQEFEFQFVQDEGNTFTMTCGHKIERDCMIALIYNTIDEKQYEIKCPYFKEGNFHCNCIWDMHICLKTAGFTSKESDQIQKIFSKNWMDQMTVTCPNPDCRIVLSKENAVENVLFCHQCMQLVITSSQLQEEQNFENFVYTNPLLEKFSLKNQDFNQNNNEYFGLKMKVEARGGFPYYQPPKGKRYGLKVNGKYDNGDDKWLGVKGLDGELAEAFHGINNPTAPYNGATVFNSIMNGMSTGTMLIVGQGQQYAPGMSVNKPTEAVGNGVYLSPHIQECLRDYCRSSVEIGGVKYKVVLQCKINPKKIKICSRQIYWVLNNSQDIRPYGVILVKEEDFNAYPTTNELFKEQFTWQRYKDQITEYLERQK